MAKIDSVYDFSDKALVELKSWLEPWFLTRCPCAGVGTAGLAYGEYVASLSDLIGYWRLGETGSPWADTSGAAGGPRNMTLQTSGTPTVLTADVTGALPPAQDDGAVQFNYDGHASAAGQYLGTTGSSFWNLNLMTAAAWVKVTASSDTRRGGILSNQEYAISGANYDGWGLQIMYPARTVRFSRSHATGGEVYAGSPGSLSAGTWYHVAGTYDGANVKLYLNGSLVATTADANNIPVGINGPARIGFDPGNFENFWLYGSVDEAAVWSTAHTAAEIAGLYASGL